MMIMTPGRIATVLESWLNEWFPAESGIRWSGLLVTRYCRTGDSKESRSK